MVMSLKCSHILLLNVLLVCPTYNLLQFEHCIAYMRFELLQETLYLLL